MIAGQVITIDMITILTNLVGTLFRLNIFLFFLRLFLRQMPGVSFIHSCVSVLSLILIFLSVPGLINFLFVRDLCLRLLPAKVCPVHTYPEIFVSAIFFMRIHLASTRVSRIRSVYPEISVYALQSGNFCIRCVFGYVWTLVSVYFCIR